MQVSDKERGGINLWGGALSSRNEARDSDIHAVVLFGPLRRVDCL